MANYLVTGGGFHRFAGKIYNSGCERGISVNQLVSHGNDALGTAFDAVYKDPRPGDMRVPVADISPGPAQDWDTTRSSVSKRPIDGMSITETRAQH